MCKWKGVVQVVATAYPFILNRTQPCRHEGPCNIQSNCICFKTRVYCQRLCWCDINCTAPFVTIALRLYAIAYCLLGIHRWTGCKCRTKKKSFFGKGRYACEDRSCPCVLADRECDPELCNGCKCKKFVAGFYFLSRICTDMEFTYRLLSSTRRRKSL